MVLNLGAMNSSLQRSSRIAVSAQRCDRISKDGRRPLANQQGDRLGSASLDAIATASRAIGAALDEANVPAQAYVLEVSTPGISRPLTERRHFLRARSRLVSLDLNDGTIVKGRLTDIDGDDVVLDGERRFPLASIVVGSIELDFKGNG